MELMMTAARATVMVALVFFLFAAPAAAVHLGPDIIHSGIDAATDATHSFWHWVSVRWTVMVSRDLKILAYSTATFLPQKVGSFLVQARAKLVAPVLRAAVVACLAMSVMLVMEAVYLNAVSLFVKLFRRTPEKRYKWEPLGEDAEAGSLAYPMVLVQIPMYNEREVYKLSIAAACGLSWPPDRIIIQVLDDSTDPEIKDLVELECRVWASKGLNINYELRNNRWGYKAGALKEGMGRTYVRLCEFVAIFDADFQPESDFLMRTIPFLIHNPEIALVQARWDFVNAKECLMTRIQKISLDYHFKVEQEAGSTAYAFFGFNGTAGIWRISALDEAGGWKDRTTVEDMDLAVRASLKGWKFVYVNDVKVKSELPATFKSYRNQQHRWTCGAANLFRKMGMDILRTKEVSLWKKLYVIYNFFFVRKVIAHVLTFTFYCVVVPVSVLVPEVEVPIWGVFYIPTTISLLNTMRNPRSIHLMFFWILFENVMAMHRMRATIIGLLEIGGVNEWVVTEKVGNALKEKTEIEAPQNLLARIKDRVYLNEVGCGVFLLFCASYNIAYGNNHYYIYIYLQAITFFIMGFGFVGTNVSQP